MFYKSVIHVYRKCRNKNGYQLISPITVLEGGWEERGGGGGKGREGREGERKEERKEEGSFITMALFSIYLAPILEETKHTHLLSLKM